MIIELPNLFGSYKTTAYNLRLLKDVDGGLQI